jgi:nucleoid DNA-binding protein
VDRSIGRFSEGFSPQSRKSAYFVWNVRLTIASPLSNLTHLLRRCAFFSEIAEGESMAENKTAKAATKSEIYQELSAATGLTRKQIGSVFDELGKIIKNHLGKKGAGVFTVPGLLKLKVIRKPATKARPGINPFTKEPTIIKAKPARNVVKAQPLKSLKEMVK